MELKQGIMNTAIYYAVHLRRGERRYKSAKIFCVDEFEPYANNSETQGKSLFCVQVSRVSGHSC